MPIIVTHQSPGALGGALTGGLRKKKKKLGKSPGALGGKIKKKNKVNKAGGGMTGVGLYPAEMARAGTMSQAKRKRYMKKGGGISYKMSGGQVVSHGYDK